MMPYEIIFTSSTPVRMQQHIYVPELLNGFG